MDCLFYPVDVYYINITILLTAILKYNCYTKTLHMFIYTVWWIWTYAYTCETITTTKIKCQSHWKESIGK